MHFPSKRVVDNIKKTFSSPGLRPFVTIFHWDTPLALEEKYGGFLSENIMYGDRN